MNRRPSWVDDTTAVAVDRDDRTHPVDRGVEYDRLIDTWDSTRCADYLTPERVRVHLHSFRHDTGQDDELDSVQVYVNGIAQLDEITVTDARRLARALTAAADLIDGDTRGGGA